MTTRTRIDGERDLYQLDRTIESLRRTLAHTDNPKTARINEALLQSRMRAREALLAEIPTLPLPPSRRDRGNSTGRVKFATGRKVPAGQPLPAEWDCPPIPDFLRRATW